MQKSLQILSLIFFYLFQNFSISAQPPAFGWVRTAGSLSKNETVVDMVLDANKAVIAAGNFYETADFDAGTGTFNLSSKGSQDIFITKYTSNGNFVWAKSIGGTGFEDLQSLKKDRQGNLYLLGYGEKLIDFDPGSGVFYDSAAAGTFLIKLDINANFLWAKRINGTGNTMDIDESDNILIGGNFGGTIDFDPGPGIFNMSGNLANGRDMFLMKLNSSGNFTWAKQIRNLGTSESQQFALQTDTEGNVFFAGSFTNSADFDPGTATFSLTSNGSDDAFILKLNPLGNFIWVKQFGASRSDKALAMEVDKQGNVFSAGYFNNTVDFDPGTASYTLTSPTGTDCVFISKLDGAGNFIYAKNFQSGVSYAQALTIDSSNNLYIAGVFHDVVDFDPGSGVYNIANGELFTAKLNPSGDFVWAAGYPPFIPGQNFESIYSSILVDQLFSVYFAGSFTGIVDFDPGTGSYPVSSGGYGPRDMFLHKLGPAPCTNSTSSIISAQVCNNYVLNGQVYNTSGQHFQLLTNSQGCDSIIQLNLVVTALETRLTQTSCGPLLWKGRILNSSGIFKDTTKLSNGCDSTVILSLTVNPKPEINIGRDSVLCVSDTIKLFAGTFSSYLWNNGSAASSIAVTQTGIYWLDVTTADGCSARDSITISASANCLTCDNPDIVEKIYPTPFRDVLNVKIKSSVCVLNMDVYNVLGQLVIKGYKIHTGINSINMQKFSAATYFYKIYSGNKVLAEGKILKL